MDQHGWFHAGSLYSLQGNHLSVQAAVDNLKIITNHYRPFLDLPEAGPATTGNKGRWFSNRPIHYVFPDANALIAAHSEGFLQPELHNFLSLAPTIATAEADLGRLRGLDRELGGLKVVGFDSPMHTHLMLSDLAGSFLAQGGEVQFSCRYIGHRRNGDQIELLLADGRSLSVDKLIITSGSEIARSQLQLGNLSVRKSPIMVIIPPLCPDNQVVVEDARNPSLSHIVHSYDDKLYSVVSGGYTADAKDEAGQMAAAKALRDTVARYFPSRFRECEAQVFFGTKVDMPVDKSSRNYSPAIVEIEKDVLIAVPGKFSFAFLLARELSVRVMSDHSSIPAPRCSPIGMDPLLIARPRHEAVARALYGAGSMSRGAHSQNQLLKEMYYVR
ncbi:hypothetical protein BSY15_2463 [Acidovorax sp. RAC01]|nr:hypothetical protein BSY15_2463 [Acidovorax sp. RAC01]